VVQHETYAAPHAGQTSPAAAGRERLANNIIGHVSNGGKEPVLSRVFEYWKNVDPDLGKKVEEGVRAKLGT
jgi:catalase